MDSKDFDGLVAGLNDVKAFREGRRKGFVVHDAVNIKDIRAKARMSQPAFAKAYHLEVSALRDWEQNRRTPERAAQVLLTLIEREPETIQRILAG